MDENERNTQNVVRNDDGNNGFWRKLIFSVAAIVALVAEEMLRKSSDDLKKW